MIAHRISPCLAQHCQRALTQAVTLLGVGNPSAETKAALIQAARSAWEATSLLGPSRPRWTAGIILARAHLLCGQPQSAICQARRVLRLTRGQPDCASERIAALTVAAEAWQVLGDAEAADHLALLAKTLAAGPVDARVRNRAEALVEEPRCRSDVDAKRQAATPLRTPSTDPATTLRHPPSSDLYHLP